MVWQAKILAGNVSFRLRVQHIRILNPFRLKEQVAGGSWVDAVRAVGPL